GRSRTADVERKSVMIDPAAVDRTVKGNGGARVFRFALKAQHQAMAVDDAGRRRQQRGDAAHGRFEAPRLRRLKPLQVHDAIRLGLASKGRKFAHLRSGSGNDQLADAAVPDTARLAVVIEALPSGDA